MGLVAEVRESGFLVTEWLRFWDGFRDYDFFKLLELPLKLLILEVVKPPILVNLVKLELLLFKN